MAEDVRAESSQPAVAIDATPTPNLSVSEPKPSPVDLDAKLEPAIEAKSGPVVEAKAELEPARPTIAEPLIAETAAAEAPKVDPQIPPAPQLDAAAAAPPVFLRDHEQRVPPRRRPAAPPPAPAKPAAEAKPKSRFTLLAATLALAAGLGAAAGAVGVPVVARTVSGPATAATPASTVDAAAEVQALKGMIAQLSTDLGALRTAVEQSGKPIPQVGKLTERLDRIEKAQAEPAARLAKIGEAIERLEKRAAAPAHDITGTIPTPPAAPEAKAKPGPTIIDDYVVRKVFDGVALVEGRRGIIEVEPGMSLPGAGRIEEIRRQDGRWVVVTSKGLILSR
jgi:hypothetical protein